MAMLVVRNCTLHDEMMERFVEFGLHETPLGKKVYEIQREFSRAMAGWDQPDYEPDFDAGESWYPKELDDLDTRYYQICDEWMEFLNNYAKEQMEKAA